MTLKSNGPRHSFAIRALALYGAIVIALQLVQFVLNRTVNRRVAGIVLISEEQRLSNAPVYFDDGSGPTRMVRTDSAGNFRFTTETWRLPNARLLICAPGFLPMYSEEQPLNNLTPSRYFILPLRPDRPLVDYTRGWRAALPPECNRSPSSA